MFLLRLPLLTPFHAVAIARSALLGADRFLQIKTSR
jgi:hypothetical protein